MRKLGFSDALIICNGPMIKGCLYEIEISEYSLLFIENGIFRFCIKKQEEGEEHLKVGEKFSFSIKGIDIYVLLCCYRKGERVKKNEKNRNETFSVNWSNKKISHFL